MKVSSRGTLVDSYDASFYANEWGFIYQHYHKTMMFSSLDTFLKARGWASIPGRL